jgi:glycosyl transferase, family 25
MDDIEIKVISLKKSQTRRDYIAKILAENGQLNWSFFDALTPDSPVPGLDVDYESQLDHFGRRLNGGEIGCFKSHFSVIRDFLDNGTRNWLLVLEDDVWFDTNFDLRELVDFIDQKDIDYIRLFAKMYKDADRIAMLSGFRQIVRFRTDPYGAQAYVINKRGAKAFLDGLTSIELPIDDELGRFWRHGLEPFGVFPFPVVERSVASSLETQRNDGQKTRSKYRWRLLAFRVSEKIRKQRHNAVFKMRKLPKMKG